MNMKFLLELVSCCCCSRPRGQLSEEKKRLLPQPGSGVRRGTKRGRPLRGAAGRFGRRNGGAPVEWQPSLSPVLEDNILPVRNEHVEASLKVTSTKVRNLRRKISSFSRPPSRVSFDDLLGRSSNHVAMPTFSPAPFMFWRLSAGFCISQFAKTGIRSMCKYVYVYCIYTSEQIFPFPFPFNLAGTSLDQVQTSCSLSRFSLLFVGSMLQWKVHNLGHTTLLWCWTLK